MHTSCVGFAASGAVGLVVFGAALDVCCCFFFPYFLPPLAAPFTRSRVHALLFRVAVVGLCLNEVLSRNLVLAGN